MVSIFSYQSNIVPMGTISVRGAIYLNMYVLDMYLHLTIKKP